MRDSDTIRKLEALYAILARTFVRYIVEAGGPAAGDDRDRKALEALRAWRAADLDLLGRLDGLLAAEKVHPAPGAYPVEFSQFHYLGAAYLLAPAIRNMEASFAALEREASGLETWPEAAALATRIVEEARGRLEGLRALRAEIAKEPAPRARPAEPRVGLKKNSSACRW